MQIKPIIFISVPTMGSINTLLADRLIRWTTSQDFSVMYHFTLNVSPVDRAREQQIDAFLKSGATHILMIDSDTIPPEDAIKKLLASNSPIATGITPMVHFKENYNAKQPFESYYIKYNGKNLKDEFVEADTGIQEVIGAGGSCLLIAREVCEKVPRPLFRNVYEDDNNKNAFISEDVYFTTKARKYGYKTLADTSVVCWHSKQIIF